MTCNGWILSRGNPRITIRLEPEIIRRLKEVAEKEGMNTSYLVRKIIRSYLEKNKTPSYPHIRRVRKERSVANNNPMAEKEGFEPSRRF